MRDKVWVRVHPNPKITTRESNSVGFVLYQNKILDQEKGVMPFFDVVESYFDKSTKEEASAVIFHVGTMLYHMGLPLANDLIVHRERWGGPIRVQTLTRLKQNYPYLDITWLKKKPGKLKYVEKKHKFYK